MTTPLQQRMFDEARSNGPLDRAADHARDYLAAAPTRRPFPSPADLEAALSLREPMPAQGADANAVIDLLHDKASRACVNAIGGRYFGFVTGGALPVALGARWLSDAWDQNAPLFRTSPAAAIIEEICEDWLRDLLRLPPETVAGFVSGSSLAIFCGLAAARWRLLQRQGWDVNAKGLNGAPPIRVVAGRGAHGTVVKGVSMLGFGVDNIEWVDMDREGRIIAESVPALDDRTLLLLQAGNVNGGAFDDFKTLCAKAESAGAWVHVDGAFGLWAAATKDYCHLTDGMELASSWSCDAHKTLNTPYDCGVVFCRDSEAIRSALHQEGSYLEIGLGRDGMYMTPELSRRARAFDVWAALKYLGREGVDELVSTLCQRTQQFRRELLEAGFEVLNEAPFNQIIFAAGDDAETDRIIAAVQEEGEAWAGGALWFGRRVVRISVCSWATTEEDVTRTVAAFTRARDARA